ncbi:MULTISPECIES: universal stress protein [Mycolicibacterium]|uniref:universal stress protein n=1 Tax=Mycolicibacterium TaxID=1866885 RepID=UPI001C3CF22D|nr:universal stress protein [Mycolicibacterium sp. PAM1]MBV5242518.1 universal stress protein [Mycolicibacterium sp. PAM1]
MATANSDMPVVAGIDGSAAALGAALWAVDEAAARGATLRLVYVTKPSDRSAAEYAGDVRHGRQSLREAQVLVQSTGESVNVETEIVDGPPAQALVALSENAQMLCVGTVGIGRYARSILGSTAADVASAARCPVAVIRPESRVGADTPHWIVVAVNDRPHNDAVVEHALQEAALRHAPVLVLGDGRTAASAEVLEQRIRPWHERYPQVHVYPIANRADVAHFLRKHDEPVLLAVLGDDEADEVAQIVGHGRSALRHGASSALVVRS